MTSQRHPPLEEVLARVERGGFARPLRVYFDTANYQSIAGNPSTNSLHEKFDRCVGQGIVVPVLSFLHVIEIATKAAGHKESLVRLLAPLVDGHRVLWVRGTGDIRRREYRHAAANQGDGVLPGEIAFGGRWSDVTERNVGPALLRRAQQPLRALVDAIGASTVERYVAVTRGWVNASAHSRARRSTRPHGIRRYFGAEIVGRAMSYAPKDLAAYSLMSVVSTPRWFDRLPALRLSLAYEEGNDNSEVRIEQGDTEDAYHLGSAVYSDIGFIDRRTRARLVAANWCPDHLRLNSEVERFLDIVCPG
jgi:hypothetical protein